MKRVLAWETSYAAEHHFRIGMPFPLLDKTRFETAQTSTPDFSAHGYDVVFAQRLAGPAPLWHELCANPDVLTVYDMDDDLLCIDPENTIPYHVFHHLEPETRRNVLAADIVTVSSPGLLERYRKIHPRVALLPICIPDEMVKPDDQVPMTKDLVVGWAGSMHKRQDWEPNDLATKLWLFAQEAPEARFMTIGADYTHGMLGHRLTSVGFGVVGDYYSNIWFSVGLAPLKDSEFNRGKCRTKLIEYGAWGIPTIASAIGEYTDWIEHGKNGFLVQHPDDWLAAMRALRDDDLRHAMGRAAHAKTKEAVISKHVHKWEDVFEGKV